MGGQHSSAGSALAWLSYRRDRIRTDPRRHWHKIGDRHHRAFRSSPFLSSYNRGRPNGFALMQQKRRQSAATRQLTTASFVSPHAQLSCNMRSVSVLPSNFHTKFARAALAAQGKDHTSKNSHTIFEGGCVASVRLDFGGTPPGPASRPLVRHATFAPSKRRLAGMVTMQGMVAGESK